MTKPDAHSAENEVGIPAPGFRMPAGMRLGAVRFQIADLDRSMRFYQDVIGLHPLQGEADAFGRGASGRSILMGAGEEPLVELVENPGAQPVKPHSRLGLYHVAILLPSREDLGRFIRHAADRGVRLGMADHLVSEAVYLSDPDGLGLEVYADRPRSAWERNRGEIKMATEPIDLRSLIAAAGTEPWDGAPAGTTIGHVHLHVGDIDRAASFYHEALGFDKVVWSYPGALFLSAGGYHHHLGTNIWARGAPPSRLDEARLIEWTIKLPDGAAVEAARRSLEQAGYSVTESDGTWSAADPWGTVVRVG